MSDPNDLLRRVYACAYFKHPQLKEEVRRYLSTLPGGPSLSIPEDAPETSPPTEPTPQGPLHPARK